MGIDAWGWVKLCLLLINVLCVLIQLSFIAFCLGKMRTPTTFIATAGITCTIIAAVLMLRSFWALDMVAFFIFVYGTPLLINLLLSLLIKKLERRHQQASTGPACIKCGYNLTLNKTGRCPECGLDV